MPQRNSILCFALLVLTTAVAAAQAPGSIQQVDRVQQRRELDDSARAAIEGENVPQIVSEENSDVGPQSVIKFAPRKSYIEAFADAQYFYTDNLFLADRDRNRQEADVLVSTVQAALAPSPYPLWDGQFSPRVGYRHQWFNFGLADDESFSAFDFNTGQFVTAKLSDFDFNVQTVFADGRWRQGNWILGVGFDFQRLLDSDDYNQFYRENTPRWEARHIFPLGEKGALSIGYEGDYRFTDSDAPPLGLGNDFNDRTDHSLVIDFAHQVCPHLVLQPYYRLQYTHFVEEEPTVIIGFPPTAVGGDNRNDLLNTIGLAAHCALSRNVSLRAFIAYDILQTNSQLAQDYEKLDVGGGLNLTIRF